LRSSRNHAYDERDLINEYNSIREEITEDFLKLLRDIVISQSEEELLPPPLK
jgi:hypothetical protein